MMQIKQMLSGISIQDKQKTFPKIKNQTENIKNISCDGCNCPMDIILNPEEETRIKVLTSPRYLMVNDKSNNCTWNVTATVGNVTLLLDKLNLKWSEQCQGLNYLYLSNIDKYSEVWLCGSGVPRFTGFKSKDRGLIIKFQSEKLESNQGFKAFLIASG